MATQAEVNEVTIFGRLLEHGQVSLTLPAAQYILGLAFPESERSRMHELSMKAQEDKLTAAEKIEIDSYERVGTLLSIWKSQARKVLKASKLHP
jgi:hypothetical protein